MPQKRILSVFVDESGDFGKLNPKSPFYYVAMVLHDQSINISEKIENFERHMTQIGYPHHAIHTGPIVRKESFYENDLMETRKSLFNSLFHFLRGVDVHYICPKINKAECEDNEIAYTAKLSKTIGDELKKHYDYFSSFDLIINYYDNGQHGLTKILATTFTNIFSNVEFRKVQPAEYKLFQVADLICTMELTNDKAERNALSKSELEFFHSAHDFKKNLYKQLAKKKLK